MATGGSFVSSGRNEDEQYGLKVVQLQVFLSDGRSTPVGQLSFSSIICEMAFLGR